MPLRDDVDDDMSDEEFDYDDSDEELTEGVDGDGLTGEEDDDDLTEEPDGEEEDDFAAEDDDRSGSGSVNSDDIFNGFFVVGDIHFRSKHLREGQDFVDKCLKKIEETYPSAIVLLGDVLDTHEIAREEPYNLACSFIEKCSKLAITFVLVGNHDYINNTQYLTQRHFFNPLKKWKNVYIVDKPTKFQIQGVTSIMCPYTPNGKFIESIVKSFDGDKRWFNGVDIVFGHQEIRGVSLRRDIENDMLCEKSSHGDTYGGGYPPLISGHIHHPQFIPPNVYYPGSAMQINFDEHPDKCVWIVNVDEDTRKLEIEKFDLGLKNLKEYRVNVNDVDKFDMALIDKYYIKLKVTGTSESFQVLRKRPIYKKLCERGVKIVFEPQIDQYSKHVLSDSVKHLTSFMDIMKELVNQQPDETLKYEFEKLTKSENTPEEDVDE